VDKIGLCNDTREGVNHNKQNTRKHTHKRSLQKADDKISSISKNRASEMCIVIKPEKVASGGAISDFK
jgi:hypothetical protein